jgi:hypothetical protein
MDKTFADAKEACDKRRRDMKSFIVWSLDGWIARRRNKWMVTSKLNA